MISIHSNDNWVLAYNPIMFKIRSMASLNDTSHGTIAAVNWYKSSISDRYIESLCARYQHVIVYLCEPYQMLDLFETYPEVTFFTDIIMDQPAPNHRYIANWFMTHDNFYQTACWAPDLLEELVQEPLAKPYRFDALLGVKRPHREVIHNAWQRSQHKDKILLTYHGRDARRGIWHVPYEASTCDIPSSLQITLWTAMPSPDGSLTHRVGTQNLVPVQIYNDCWFSIIAEGFMDRRGTRLTEKTAKALVAGRLFVYFGAPRDLSRIRQLGFQTFGAVIDESYDSIPDDLERWQAAWQQVEWLCEQDPHEILAATQTQREHNRQVFLTTDWYANLRSHLRDICAKY